MMNADRYDDAAAVYDAGRPGYPAQLFADVSAYAALEPRSRLLDIGAGTGKATEHFARRGFTIDALEPSEAMARELQTRLAGQSNVRIHCARFEDWKAESREYACIYAASSWHWVPRPDRLSRAHTLLQDDGTLALFWHRPVVPPDIRSLLDHAYERHAPGFAYREPNANPPPTGLAGDEEINGSHYFHSVVTMQYRWTETYTADRYLALLDTGPPHRNLEPKQRSRLYGDLRNLIESVGGLKIPHLADLVCARAVGSAIG